MSGKIRLACGSCDRNDFDGVPQLPDDWDDIGEVQSFEDSIKEIDFNANSGSPWDWYTHLGTCPECQQEDGDE